MGPSKSYQSWQATTRANRFKCSAKLSPHHPLTLAATVRNDLRSLSLKIHHFSALMKKSSPIFKAMSECKRGQLLRSSKGNILLSRSMRGLIFRVQSILKTIWWTLTTRSTCVWRLSTTKLNATVFSKALWRRLIGSADSVRLEGNRLSLRMYWEQIIIYQRLIGKNKLASLNINTSTNQRKAKRATTNNTKTITTPQVP